MNRAVAAAAAVIVVGGCGSVSREPVASPSSAPDRWSPVSCHEAFFEPLPPLAGDRIVRVPASPRAPLTLGVRLIPPKRRFVEVRIDVLPAGGRVLDDPSFREGRQPHVRRYAATSAQMASQTVAFEFDGRDGSGRVLPAGSYEIGFFARTRSDDPTCTALNQPPGLKYGQLGTVDWTPA